jgi:TM2 domain-containing membrane protein YozV
MANPAEKNPVSPPKPFTLFPAFLSYLVPGLGQIYQGRVAKGVLFLVCLYTLFFYGLFLGRVTAGVERRTGAGKLELQEYTVTSNVYLPTVEDRGGNPYNGNGGKSNLLNDLYHRPQFLGQFWMGIAVWPAVWQYATYDKTQDSHPILGKFMRTPRIDELNAVNTGASKIIDLGWVYTVIAGVLNILVIYDALAGPAFPPQSPAQQPTPKAMT